MDIDSQAAQGCGNSVLLLNGGLDLSSTQPLVEAGLTAFVGGEENGIIVEAVRDRRLGESAEGADLLLRATEPAALFDE